MKKLILILMLFISTLGISQSVTADKVVIKTVKPNTASNQVMVRNTTTGVLEYVDKNSLGGGIIDWNSIINKPIFTDLNLQSVLLNGNVSDGSIILNSNNGNTNNLLTPRSIYLNDNQVQVALTPRVLQFVDTPNGISSKLWSSGNGNYYLPYKDPNGTYTLVTTSDFKTINGQSLVGTGDLTISGGSSISGTANNIPKINTEGNGLVGSSISDSGTEVTINSKTKINSGVIDESGLSFSNFKLYNNLVERLDILDTYQGYQGYVSLTIDSDNNVYTISGGLNNESDLCSLVKITPQGVSTLLASFMGEFEVIAVDTTKNVYATYGASNLIRKITPSGIVTTFATLETRPTHMLFDNSGNLMVTGYSTNKLYKITPDGTVIDFANVGSGPIRIAKDLFGNLFTLNYNSDTVSKITSLGIVTTLGNSSSTAVGICTDKEGNVYTSHNANRSIIKLTANGVRSVLYTTPVGTSTYGMVSDSNGFIYINLYSSNPVNRGIIKINREGEFIEMIPQVTTSYKDIVINSNDLIYTSGFNDVVKYTLKEANKPITVDLLGNVVKNNNLLTIGTSTVLPNSTIKGINSDQTNKSIITKEWFSNKIGTVAPTSTSDAGNAGDIRVVDGFIYWYVLGTGWLRSTGTTF